MTVSLCAPVSTPQLTIDTAYDALLAIVTSISAIYGEQLQDDIAQAMWVQVFELLQDGPEETGVLIKAMKYAAVDEAERHRRMGFTPHRSEISEPPARQLVPSLGFDDRNDDGELCPCHWSEPSSETVEKSNAALEHLLTLCVTDDQRSVVEAGARIKARFDYDQESVKLGYQCSLREETRLSAKRIRLAQEQLTEIFKSEFGHDPLNR